MLATAASRPFEFRPPRQGGKQLASICIECRSLIWLQIYHGDKMACLALSDVHLAGIARLDSRIIEGKGKNLCGMEARGVI
jgi:hypothetical protein